jgi:hypothetical protein
VTPIAANYDSATDNLHAPTRAAAEGATDEGAEVRLRHTVHEVFNGLR